MQQERADLVDYLVLGRVVAEGQGGVAEDVVDVVYEAWGGGEAGLEGAGDDLAGVGADFMGAVVCVWLEVRGCAVEEKLTEPDA